MNNKDFDNKALFDMYDRLLASYIKFNCFNIAKNYAKLEMNIAKQNKDMEAIANRTQSKLYYLNDIISASSILTMWIKSWKHTFQIE